jgi:transcriptional regulator of acetoin/glycerol metabolism
MDQHLKTERRRLVDAWHTYQTRHDQGGAEAPGPEIPPELLASWQRSALSVPPDRVSAPLDDEPETVSAWADSQLEFALRPLLPELRAVAAEGDLIVAVADASGKLTWTEGSRRMTPLARGINFVPGSHWDEPSVGTNALALALRHVKPVRVFAAEHYVQTVHDWVCGCRIGEE